MHDENCPPSWVIRMSGEQEDGEDVHIVRFVDMLRSASKSLVPSLLTVISMIASGFVIIQSLNRIPLILSIGLTDVLLRSTAIAAMGVIAIVATSTYVSRSSKRKERSARFIRSKESKLFRSIESELARVLERR